MKFKHLTLIILALLATEVAVYGQTASVGTHTKQIEQTLLPADDINRVDFSDVTSTFGEFSMTGDFNLDGDINSGGNITGENITVRDIVAAGGDVSVGKHIIYASITTVFNDYSAVNDNSLIYGNASTVPFTIHLDSLSNFIRGESVRILKDSDDLSFNDITIDPFGSETIGGDSTLVLGSSGDAITISKKDNSNWRIIQKAVSGEANITWATEVGRVRTVVGGPYYTSGGYYHWADADIDLTQASPTATHGTANEASMAHVGYVFGAYAAAGGSGSAFLDISGISYNDNGTAGPTVETLVSDLSTASLNDYFESIAKYDGTVTYILRCTGTCNHTTYSTSGNVGHTKYQDFGNRDFILRNIRCGPNEADANDSGFNICVKAHSSEGWTYAATGFIAGDGDVACLKTDRPNAVLLNGEYWSWDHSLDTPISIAGSEDEGLIIELTNATNNSAFLVVCKSGVTF
jgi:hypothetical protein